MCTFNVHLLSWSVQVPSLNSSFIFVNGSILTCGHVMRAYSLLSIFLTCFIVFGKQWMCPEAHIPIVLISGQIVFQVHFVCAGQTVVGGYQRSSELPGFNTLPSSNLFKLKHLGFWKFWVQAKLLRWGHACFRAMNSNDCNLGNYGPIHTWES